MKEPIKQITPEQFKSFITAYLNDYFIPFLYEKNKKYKGASFQDGLMALVGNVFRQSDKMERYKSIVFDWINSKDKGDMDSPFGESVFDTISDQLGYALIGITICAMNRIGPISFEEFCENGEKEISTEFDHPDEVFYETREYPPFGFDFNLEEDVENERNE